MLGTVAGHLPGAGGIGLVYLDVHGDLNTPDSEPDGALDWMGVAHMLGDPGTPRPSCASSARARRCSTTIRSCCSRTTRCTARRTSSERIERRGLAPDRARRRRRRSGGGARAALAALAACDRLAVHFDVDCIDFTDAPLSENTGRNAGLRQDDAFAALAEVLRDPRVSALTITELNPDHGADGATLSDFSERLVPRSRGAALRG